ncbi:H-2 class I histocompatibility antigen, Q10 alpha chain-like isoform X2 [Osmerus mordax]|uniref:H-2 class I histocompatibility antigen, Q10 alpha chain-like isoform X2 n=1 Tax=Osmerus mordax TaxID=8014 RepID=UPI00350F6F0B
MHLVVAALVLFGLFLPVNSGRHSLEYIYTALSKPIDRHGIHEFTAMGLLNDRMIDYYDNDLQKKVPRQDWMKERLDKDYWDKGTQSRKFKEQWFKVNIGILMDRMRQNDSDVHSLQWRHGCEVEEKQGSVRFIKGFDQYSYDGDDFLAFDDTSTQWVAPNAAALPTKRKWDGEQILNQYTKGYLEKECVDWLNKFMDYGEKSLFRAKPPVVDAYGKASKTVGNVKLTCWATGFLPKDITLHIRKNEVVISDGVETSGVRPNHDDTHQIWKRVEIPMNDQGNYDCFVKHQALPEPIIKAFPENKCGDCATVEVGTIGGVVGFIICLALVGGLLFVLYKRGIITLPRHTPSKQLDKKGGSDSNSDSGHSSSENSSLTGSTQSVDASAGHSSDRTPYPPGTTKSIGASAGTANESAAPLRNKDSTQHMDDGSNSSDSGAGSHKSLSQSSREEVV